MANVRHFNSSINFRRPHPERAGAFQGVQTYSRIKPGIEALDAQGLRQAVNAIRPIDQPATGGIMTVNEELYT